MGEKHNNSFREDSSSKHHEKAVGHERPLASMIKRGRDIHIEFVNDKEPISGLITSFDKFSITVNFGGDIPITYFKHNISGFTEV